jgi:hypothetical protein
MPATVSVSTIAERTLRRLNVTVVPLDDRPTMTEMVPAETIATMALVELGVIASNSALVDDPPAMGTIVTVDAIATNALTKIGVIASDEPPLASDQALARAAVIAVHDSLAARGIVDWTSAEITTSVSEEYAMLTASHIASAFGKTTDPALIPMLEKRIGDIATMMGARALALDKVASVHAALDAMAVVWWDGTAVPRAFVEEYTKLTAAQAASSFGKAADPATVALLEGRVKRGAMGIASHDIAVEGVMAVHTELVGKGIARWTSTDIPEMAAPAYEMLAAYNLAPKFPPAEQKPADVVQAMRTLFTITALPTSGERVVAEYF